MNILITGADSGIGKQLANDYERLGHKVICTYLQPGRDFQLDLDDLESIKRCAQAIGKLGLKFDILLNVAGISTWGPQLEIDDDAWEKIIRVNLFGTRHFLKYCLPSLSQHAKIATVTSCSRYVMMPFMGSYPLSKSALHNCLLLVQREFSFSETHKNMQFTSFDLGSVKTPIWEKAANVHFDKTTELGKFSWTLGNGIRAQELKNADSVESVSRKIIQICARRKLKPHYSFAAGAFLMYWLGKLPHGLFGVVTKILSKTMKQK